MGDDRPAGSKVWSPEEWEAYSRLKAEVDEAAAAAAEAIRLHGDLQDRMGRKLGKERMWDHKSGICWRLMWCTYLPSSGQ